MQVEHKDLSAAVTSNIITKEQADKLWDYWTESKKDTPSFRFVHLLYYLGGMIAISAVTIYVTNAWDRFQGFPLLFLALALLLFGLSVTHKFLEKDLRIPAGIMAAFSLALIPLIVYNIQFLLGMSPNDKLDYTDFHYWIDWYWYNMELATLIVGCIMLYFYRLPFLMFPIAVILWYMSMDLWPLLANKQYYTFEDRAIFSMFFGLFILAATMYIDFQYDNDNQDDYLFWLYIVGVVVFWGGLSCQDSDSELSKFFYFLINLLMLFTSVFVNRRVFAVFGVLGMLGYLGHLAFTVFANSLGFPIVLIMIGVLIILAGVFYSRVENKMREAMRPYLPEKVLRRMR